MKTKIICSSLLCFFSLAFGRVYAEPRVTVICVIDNMGYHDFINITSQLKSGIKFIYDKGVSYTDVTVPLGSPGIAPGYATLATGALPRDHGIVDDSWIDEHSQKQVNADDDDQRSALVFAPQATYSFGKSARELKVDALSDQLALSILPEAKRYTSYAMSFKSAPAIFIAGKLGKPLWFDSEGEQFTSSRAFFNQLPPWLITWNHQNRSKMLKKDQAAGDLPTNQADALLVDLAYTCFSNHFHYEKSSLVLWLGFNTLDASGEQTSDLLRERMHRLDLLLGKFIRALYHKVKAEEVLFVVTSSQGATPSPEFLQASGFTLAQRLHTSRLAQDIDTFIYQRYGIPHVVKFCTGMSVYVDQTTLGKLELKKRQSVLEDVKKFLQMHEGIQDAWTFSDLYNLPMEATNVRSYLKNQLYRPRSGQLSYLVQPYTLVTTTLHEKCKTPYAYDTHVPLIMYQKGSIENKRIQTAVTLQQLPVTIAHILGAPRPSAATSELLPDIIKKN